MNSNILLYFNDFFFLVCFFGGRGLFGFLLSFFSFNWHRLLINFITYFQLNEWTFVSMQVPRSHMENIYLWDLLKEINATKWLYLCSLFPLCAAEVNLRTFIHWRLRGTEELPRSSGYDLNSGHNYLLSRPVTLLDTFCLIIQSVQKGSTRMLALISCSLKMCRWSPVRRAQICQWHDYLGRCQRRKRKAPVKQGRMHLICF